MQKKEDIWRIWDRNDAVEGRTYQRVRGELPEMESTRHLVSLIGEVYQPGMKVLDVGCAAGHFYNGLTRIDPKPNYHGVDATVKYIEFAKNHFAKTPNVRFSSEDVFNLPFDTEFDIVHCCNVLLHLPSVDVPIQNLVRASRKYVFIRMLVSDHTHLSKYLYKDTFDENGEPNDFVYQNTYSRDLIRSIVKKTGDHGVDFVEDVFDPAPINDEYRKYGHLNRAVTRAIDDKLLIAGSKVFEWQVVKITKVTAN